MTFCREQLGFAIDISGVSDLLDDLSVRQGYWTAVVK